MKASTDQSPPILAEEVSRLFSARPAATLVGVAAAGWLGFTQRHIIDSTLIAICLALMVAAALAHEMLQAWYQRTVSVDVEASVWLRRLRWAVSMSGAAWGVSGWLLFPAGDRAHQTVLLVVLGGVSVYAVATLAIDLLCASVFPLLALTPMVARLLIERGADQTMEACTAALFVCLLLATVRVLHRGASEASALRAQIVGLKKAVLRGETPSSKIFDIHDLPMLVVDAASGSIEHANAAAGRFYGHSVEHLCKMNVGDIGADKPDDTAETGARGSDAQHSQYVAYHRLASGEARQVEVRSSLAHVGERAYRFLIVHDIADHPSREASLNLLHDAALTSDNYAILITDKVGRITWANQAFCGLTGYSFEEVIGRKCKELIHSGLQSPEFYQQLWQTITAGRSWQGELVNRHKDGSLYHEEMTIKPVRGQDGTICNFVAIKQDISERKNMEEQIQKLAFYDALTQLPNRRLLLERLAHAVAASKRGGQYGALMFLDLDRFKAINDTYGHDFGDSLLVEVAHRITHCVRSEDTVARLGGDEFVVMLEKLDVRKEDAAAKANSAANNIRASLAKPYILQHRQSDGSVSVVECHCSASIGIALFNHEVGKEDVLKWADTAMYQAKADGRNDFRFSDYSQLN